MRAQSGGTVTYRTAHPSGTPTVTRTPVRQAPSPESRAGWGGLAPAAGGGSTGSSPEQTETRQLRQEAKRAEGGVW